MGGRGGVSHRVGGGGSLARAQSFLERAYGATHANAVMAFLGNAPSAIQELWAEFAGSFRAARADPNSDEAYYSASRDSVYLGINDVARGDSIHTPYSTVFHEYGHMTDYLIARKQGHGQYDAYSDTYRNGLLGRTAKEELEGHLRRFQQMNPNYTREDAAGFLIREA